MHTLRGFGIIWLGVALSTLTGCLTHEARITVPPDARSDKPADAIEGRTVLGDETFVSPPGPPLSTIRRGPLPQDICVTAWRRDADGVISRGDAQVRTALPWWQRFPFDMATDLVPADLVVQTDTTLAIMPVTTRSRAQLDAEAAAAGYASVTPPPQPNP